jgi:hypothetical protein
MNGGNGECLGCQLMEISPVTLREGKTVCSSCPMWRAECEARMVVGLASLDQRRDYIAGVAKERGRLAADALKAEVAAEWKRKAA